MIKKSNAEINPGLKSYQILFFYPVS